MSVFAQLPGSKGHSLDSDNGDRLLGSPQPTTYTAPRDHGPISATWANRIIHLGVYQKRLLDRSKNLGLCTAALLLGLMAGMVGALPVAHPQAALGVAGSPAGGSTRSAWMISVSMNCNNREICTGELFLGQEFKVGGLWGVIKLFNDGTGVAEFTACMHSISDPGLMASASHISVSIGSWVVGSHGTFVVLSGTETFRGGTAKGTQAQIIGPVDTGIPDRAGHYTGSTIPGLPTGPGVSIQIQVHQLGVGTG